MLRFKTRGGKWTLHLLESDDPQYYWVEERKNDNLSLSSGPWQKDEAEAKLNQLVEDAKLDGINYQPEKYPW